MLVKRIVVGLLQTNCFVIKDEKTGKGAVIDPGGDADRVIKTVEKLDIELEHIIATHGHFDHIGGVKGVKDRFPEASFIMHEDDMFLLNTSSATARMWGIRIQDCPQPDKFITPGDDIPVGDISLEVRHTPGHSPGSVSLIYEQEAFVGDTLFQGSVGRTDFPQGSSKDLKKSISEQLYTLTDDTVVYTGHGPDTTILSEKKFNMFVRG